jgi:hypothetical protein
MMYKKRVIKQTQNNHLQLIKLFFKKLKPSINIVFFSYFTSLIDFYLIFVQIK